MQGEYSLPPNTPLPRSAADLALQQAAAAGAAPAGGGGAVPAGGRWRVQVVVPAAELQEIVPAARLLQSATSLSPAEYERAKTSFLHVSGTEKLAAWFGSGCGVGPVQPLPVPSRHLWPAQHSPFPVLLGGLHTRLADCSPFLCFVP